MKDLYNQWIDTLQCADIKPLSGDTCCKLLAITYAFGGEREAFTLNKKIAADIKYAQKRLNIIGGGKPNGELLPYLQNYIKELMPDGPLGECIKKDWAVKLMSSYNIKL